MATFVIPKVWAFQEVLTAADLNAAFTAFAASVNAVDDTQISAGANINGSKLANAPNGITTAKINDAAITTAKLAIGAADVGNSFDDSSGSGGQVVTSAVDLVQVQRSVSGGTLLVCGWVTFDVTHAVNAETTEVTLRLKRGGTVLGIAAPVQVAGLVNYITGFALPLLALDSQTGSFTWSIEAERTAGTGSVTARSWQLYVWELK